MNLQAVPCGVDTASTLILFIEQALYLIQRDMAVDDLQSLAKRG